MNLTKGTRSTRKSTTCICGEISMTHNISIILQLVNGASPLIRNLDSCSPKVRRNMSEAPSHAQKRLLRDFKEIKEATDNDQEQLRGMTAARVHYSIYSWIAIEG